MANAINEADEEESDEEETKKGSSKGAGFEIQSVLVEKRTSGQISAQVSVIEEGVQKDYCLVDEKVFLSGFSEVFHPE